MRLGLWFDTRTVPETGFGTLDRALWKPLLSVEGADDPALALEKLGLLARGATGAVEATVTGLLLCSQTPEEWLPNAVITATHYRGTDRASGQLDAQTITGPLSRQIAEAVAFAVRNMRVGAYKSPARIDLPQYSERALFEAIVNAAAHRDYSIRGSRIRLSMFADRIEINSPGGLPNNLAVDTLAMRQSTRNEALASALGRLPVGTVRGAGDRRYFMERRGDGVPTILRETRALSGRLPEYRLIGGSDLFLTIPAAENVPSPARTSITVRCRGAAVPGVDLLVLMPNETWRQAVTDAAGEASVELHLTHLPVTVFAAAAGYQAHLLRDWLPNRRALTIELAPLADGGAVIFTDAIGEIPGLAGRLNPVRDERDRTYLYASNIAINQGQPQPVDFLPGESLRLTDADGRERLSRILAVVGRASLIEYRPIG